MKTVLILDSELEGCTDGPWEYLVNRFKKEHGLVFTEAQLEKGDGFKFEQEVNDRAFQVTWLGPIQ